ncbi:MAG TPA: hypothetical protein VJB87_00905 [Candidatus Nanoarchaeia archaeon]|nr:hypothetical protein [Candidatus Nanoarchaeia archaeon]
MFALYKSPMSIEEMRRRIKHEEECEERYARATTEFHSLKPLKEELSALLGLVGRVYKRERNVSLAVEVWKESTGESPYESVVTSFSLQLTQFGPERVGLFRRILRKSLIDVRSGFDGIFDTGDSEFRKPVVVCYNPVVDHIVRESALPSPVSVVSDFKEVGYRSDTPFPFSGPMLLERRVID